MGRRMLLYRGSLKSCNYSCSYCPFSKHPQSKRELEKDREQWYSFVSGYQKRAAALNIGALMIVPYGEAMLYPWYWEGMAKISTFSETDAVGIQTNLSFSVETFLDCYQKAGGVVEKARFWVTFHPEMTTVAAFVKKCTALYNAGVTLCAGSVGVPQNLELLQQLREELPTDIYLWVNQMDGLRRPYTQQEKQAFLEIDPYFERELLPIRADVSLCYGRLFMEADGKLRACNISSTMESGWAALGIEQKETTVPCAEQGDFPEPKCTRKQCSCYLAYGGRADFINRVLFGKYPLFRIPRRPKAAFLDIEGTLLSSIHLDRKHLEHKHLKSVNQSDIESNSRKESNCFISRKKDASINIGNFAKTYDKNAKVSADCIAGLEALAKENTSLLFATTLPCQEAIKRCASIKHLFQGGVFAGGAHIVLWGNGEKKEFFHLLEISLLTALAPLQQKYHFRILKYQNGAGLYKITLLRSARQPWGRQEVEEIKSQLSTYKSAIRYIVEANCLQIVSAKASKANGVEMLCGWLGISPKEAVAAGDSEWDKEMIDLCGE